MIHPNAVYKGRSGFKAWNGAVKWLTGLIPSRGARHRLDYLTKETAVTTILELLRKNICTGANMPRHAADLEEALNKKGGLTLSQLANYDDLITDALVDRVCPLAICVASERYTDLSNRYTSGPSSVN